MTTQAKLEALREISNAYHEAVEAEMCAAEALAKATMARQRLARLRQLAVDDVVKT